MWSGARTKMNRIKQALPKRTTGLMRLASGKERLRETGPSCQCTSYHATGRFTAETAMNRFGFPRPNKPKSAKRIHGFQTGDMVRCDAEWQVQRTSCGQGRVRASEFDLAASGKPKISASWKRFTLLQRFDGYAYGYHRLKSSV